MSYKKAGWLINATMKKEGLFSETGELLASGPFSTKAVKEFNPPAKVAKVKETKKK